LKIATMRELDSGKGVGEVARTYQVSPKRLETWRGEWRARGELLAFPGHAALSQTKLDAQRIPELERKIGQQAMAIDFLKKVLRRFREQSRPLVGNGDGGSTQKSGKRPKRGLR
jgi:transposase-like protein